MQQYALMVGSDCPFFIQNKPMLVSGRGEFFDEISINLKDFFLVLVKPETHVSTAMAYSGIIPIVPAVSIPEIIKQPVSEWRNMLSNDFEKTVFAKFPELEKCKFKMYELGAVYASMTGSGSSIYGLFEKEVDIRNHFNNMFYFSHCL